jgi:tetratricopeptide (TPR) repeat protein
MNSLSSLAAARRIAAAALTCALLGLPQTALHAQTADGKPARAAGLRPLDPQEQAEVFYLALLGEMLVRDQQLADAYQALAEAARRSNDPALYRRASEVAWRAGLQSQALASARQWAEANPDDREAPRVLAQIYATLNRPKEALPYLQRELKRTPEDGRGAALLTMQRVLGTAADKQAAFDATRELVAGDAARPEAAVALARAGFAAGKADEAWSALDRVSTEKPGLAAAAVLAIENFDRAPERAAAIGKRYALAARSVDAVTIEVLRRMSVAKQDAEAARLAEQLSAQHPQSAEVWLVLGNLRDQLNQPEAAELAYLQAVRIAQNAPPDQPPAAINAAGTTAKDAALVALAAGAEKRRDYARARDWIAQISANELQSDAQVRLVGSAIRAKDWRMAERLVAAMPEATAQDRQLKWALNGQLLREQGRLNESMQMYDKAVAEIPDDADIHYEASFTAEKLKRYDRMEQLLRRAIELKPHFAQAYNALGYSFADRGVRLDEARELLEKAVSLAPDDAYIIDSLGWLHYRAGRKDEALAQLQKAYGLKQDPEIAAHLGEVLWELGRKDEALQTWRSAAAAAADNDTLRETLKRYRIRF